MTPTNAEFNGEFKEIPLKIEIELKITGENKQTAHLEGKFLLVTKNLIITEEKNH